MARPRLYRVALNRNERSLIKRLQKKTASSTIRSRCAVLLEADEKRWKRVKKPAKSRLHQAYPQPL